MIDPNKEFSGIALKPVENSSSEWLAHWTVPEKLAYFEGHFPGNPILPGFGIVDACQNLAQKAHGARTLKKIARAKFLRQVLPGHQVVVVIRQRAEQTDFKWSVIQSDGTEGLAAQLSLVF